MSIHNIMLKSWDKLLFPALIEKVSELNAKRVLFQFPEGLIHAELLNLVNTFQNKGIEVFISGNACWGGCDLPLEEVYRLKCDLVVHYGHSPYPHPYPVLMDRSEDRYRKAITVVWVEVQSTQPIQNILEEVVMQIKTRFGNRTAVSLVTNIQHVHQLAEMQNFLEKRGITTYVSHPQGKTSHPGQILGCDVTTAILTQDDIDTYVYLGSGKFHGLSVGLTTGKPVLHADPFERSCEWLDKETNRLLKKRYAIIEAARNAEKWGIIVGLRSAQFRLKLAQKMQKWLEAENKETLLLILRDVTGERIMAFNFLDAFVVTSCPRIAIDDSEQFIKPVLNSYELGVLLGKKKWSKYEFF
ncbi:MAG: diphthamide biosynthesis enzyme Dph2 [Candidatus Heimdallarchaeota archaeon]